MAKRPIRTYTKGASVRYIGNDPKMKDAWGESVYRVLHKRGDYVVGYFPVRYSDGRIHLCEYLMKIDDLAIVY